jgi:L-alanine-DL-glutamate epimerase-like enolase superfamily enzyme
MKIAAMVEAYEVNCTPHNFYGHMSTLMSAHFCAAIPNFRIMEIDIDDVPWRDDLVTEPPHIENGHLILPTKPGWGADVSMRRRYGSMPRSDVRYIGSTAGPQDDRACVLLIASAI